MDDEIVHESCSTVDDFDSVAPEAGSIDVEFAEGLSCSGEVNGELERAGEFLTRLELDIACASEKLVNLSILTMHVAARESDFEPFTSEKDSELIDYAENSLVFDFLSGVLDSEVKDLDRFVSSIQTDIISAREMIGSFRHLGETFVEMEKKLHDSEESLKQSQDQVSEIKQQSAKFQRILACHDGKENWNGEKSMDLAEKVTAKIRMQTAEEQRHVLRMLEKSLAREMDLEKKLTESRQIEEELKLRLLSSQQEVFCMEEEVADVYERCFEAENSVEVLSSISKDVLARQQMIQFYLNNSIRRETELRSKHESSSVQLESKESLFQKLESSNARVNVLNDGLKARLEEAENNLILADSEVFTLREILISLANQLKESGSKLPTKLGQNDEIQKQRDAFCSEISELQNAVEDLKEKLSKTEKKAESAETRCKLLDETNMKLNEELGLLKDSGATVEKVKALKKQIKEYDTQLQHAIASAEASQEKQHMYYSTIEDMELLIEDLKLKVANNESRAENAERKCIMLSDSNAELSEAVSYMRRRLKCLEAALNQSEEMKMATAKDIGFRSKIIMNLVTQLAVERERLHRQISALAVENKILKSKKMDKDPSIAASHESVGNCRDLATAPIQVEKTWKRTESVGETDTKTTDATSDFDTVRRIDTRVLNLKHILLALVVLMISVMGYSFHQNSCPF